MFKTKRDRASFTPCVMEKPVTYIFYGKEPGEQCMAAAEVINVQMAGLPEPGSLRGAGVVAEAQRLQRVLCASSQTPPEQMACLVW